jgi:UPF0716 family protein affecting phage T7 exclusion
MFSKSASVLAVATLAEFAFFVFAASRFNPFLVALVALACSVLGFRLLFTRIPLLLAQQSSPGPDRPLVDAVLHVVGAGLLIMPGLLTAALGGLLLFVPPVRWLLAPVVGSRLERLYPISSLETLLRRSASPWSPFSTGKPAHRGDVVDVTGTAKDSPRGSASASTPPELN